MRSIPWQSATLAALAACYYYLLGSQTDVYLLCLGTLWRRWQKGVHLLPIYQGHWHGSTLPTLVALAGGVLLAVAYFASRKRQAEPAGPVKPMLFPCKTTHVRLFPKKHTFDYSYLMVGVPVNWEGVAGGMISNGDQPWWRRGWYQVKAADYLERGGGDLGLRGKLDAYLKSQGVDPSQYPYAYLTTAAKFLGYHFNPVSFWYLYSADRNMTAMILEVNNTFDERRMYFLTSTGDDGTNNMIDRDGSGASEGPSQGKLEQVASTPMRRAWPKDFHVSPFNSRKGGYSLVAHDLFAPMMQGNGSIETTITLTSSKNHSKLVARVFSDGPALDPTTMTLWQKLKFLGAWWWVGLVTFPRIVKEAGLLWFKRKLHVWYRPEPLKESMGRHADATEQQLEPFFRRYLKHLVSQSPASSVVRYIPSGLPDVSAETIKSPSAEKDSDTKETEIMEFKVLTPAFYTRFVYYAHDLEALFCELNDNCTVWVSRPDLLPKLVFKKPPPPLGTANALEFAGFDLIRKLRRRPDRIERPMTSSQTTQTTETHTKIDIRDFRLSSMDAYILSHEAAADRKIYCCSVLKLFVADRVALGSLDLLWLEHFILKAVLAGIIIHASGIA